MLNERSEKCLATIDDGLAAVVRLAHTFDPSLQALEGARTLTRQHELYGQGRTRQQLKIAGVNPALARPAMPKVTWTLNSRHFPDPKTGKSRAVDVWPGSWDDLRKFDRMASAMFKAAEQLGVEIRWGANWDRDGNPRERGETDSPHFELA